MHGKSPVAPKQSLNLNLQNFTSGACNMNDSAIPDMLDLVKELVFGFSIYFKIKMEISGNLVCNLKGR